MSTVTEATSRPGTRLEDAYPGRLTAISRNPRSRQSLCQSSKVVAHDGVP